MQQFGRGVQQLGNAAAEIAQAQDQANEYEAERRFQEFKWSEKLALDETKQNIEPGQAENLPGQWADSYQERASQFLKTFPESLKPKYDLKLFGAEREMYREAANFARKEQKRFSINSLEDFRQNYLLTPKAANEFATAKEDYRSVVEKNPYLTPIEKDEQLREGLNEFEKHHIEYRLKRGDPWGEIVRDLRGNRPDVDTPGEREPGTGERADVKPGTLPKFAKRVTRFSSEVNTAITNAAKANGVDPRLLGTFAQIESGGRPDAKRGSYKGLFQLSDGVFAEYGGEGDIYDPEANAHAAARKLKSEIATFKDKYGRKPEPVDLYLMHQQGEGGYAAHVSNPDAPAWENMHSTAEGQQKGEGWAKQAIWGNIPADQKKRFSGVEDVTSQDFIDIWRKKVTAIGGGETQTADMDGFEGLYSHLSLSERQGLLDKLRGHINRDLKQAEDLAEQGFALPENTYARLQEGVEELGDTGMRQRLQQLEAVLEFQDAARTDRPEELAAFIENEQQAMQEEGATPFRADRLKLAKKRLSNIRSELKSDPLGYAARTGTIDVPDLDFSDAEAARKTMQARIERAEYVASYYGQEPVYLRSDEKRRLATVITKGGDNALAVMSSVADAAGPERALAVMSEISDEAPEAAFLGSLVARTGITPAARDAVEGMRLKAELGDAFKPLGPSKTEGRPVVVDEVGSALRNMPKTEGALTAVARSIYEVRARRQGADVFDEDIYRKALREAVGQREVNGEIYGGVAGQGFFGGNNIIVPPNIRQDGFDEVIDMITHADLAAAELGNPVGISPGARVDTPGGETIRTGAAPSAEGETVSLDRLKNATLVQYGDGQYALALGDPNTPGAEQWIYRDRPGEPFILDMNALALRLSRRRPELFLGAEDVE